jgi:signal transduction histidine kinase/CheY-like chemotaxis protein
LFNVSIALLLMEFGVFGALEKVLGLFSNISIAWISTVAADLLINKPLQLSPRAVEFKRAYLPDLNPVGTLSTLFASVISIAAYLGLFGLYAQAFSALIALLLAFMLTPLIAKLYGRKRYLVRYHSHKNQAKITECIICANHFEQEDMAHCPFYEGNICSLCCTLDSRCMDACKKGFRLDDYLEMLANMLLPKKLSLLTRIRLVRFALLFVFLSVLTSVFIGIIYYQDLLNAEHFEPSFRLLQANFVKVFTSLLVFIGLCTWWLILNDESRRVAQGEMDRQTQRLKLEIAEHKKTDAKLQEATKAADRANTAKSRFLSSMSHEIRTPLNSILGYSYILHSDPAIPKHRRQAVEILKRSGEHLSALIEDILDIAKIEAGKFDLNQDIFNFSHFIEHLVSFFQPQANEKGLLFKCQLLNTLPQRVRGDEKRVGQILINLLGNAVKFTNQGVVVFRVGYSCGVATFQVIDTGPGIETEQLENIFHPFTQIANERHTPGSGLGLTISKILAQIMGGELSVESIPGEGSTFTVRLYLANLGGEQESIPKAIVTGYIGVKKRILVVDDQPDHRQLLRNILEPIGFTVDEADNGRECLAMSVDNPADLILLDINMPDLDGYETAYALRARNIIMPIIVLTADAYPADRVKAINAGCNDFLAKPLTVADMLLKLKLQLGLEWTYQDDETSVLAVPVIESSQPRVVPPGIVNELANYARIGDLHGLNRYLQESSQELNEYPDFFHQIESLSKAYRLSELKKLLEQP